MKSDPKSNTDNRRWGWPLPSLVMILLTLLALASCVYAQPHETRQVAQHNAESLHCDADNGGLQLPAGFCALVVADNLGQARHLAVRDNGDLYVALRRPASGGGIVALRDSDGDGRMDLTARFGALGGTGLEIDGDYLYFGAETSILRYRLAADRLEPEAAAEVLVAELPAQRQHAAKSLALDGQGRIYVNIGAPSNACQEQPRTPGSPGQDPCPQLLQQAGIWRFRADLPGQRQATQGERYATGIRNAVALAWNPFAEALYAAQHGRDQLQQLWPRRYSIVQSAELPAEEFLLVKSGADFGWPYCYYDQLQQKRVLAPEYGGDGRLVGDCADYGLPISAFPGHWAPNDLLFYRGGQFPVRYRGGAFIAFHGSWNRAPLEQRGYRVVFVPFAGQLPDGAPELFADGFAGIAPITHPRDARFRPMGLAEGADGSLYIVDSQQGRIWRVLHAAGAGAGQSLAKRK